MPYDKEKDTEDNLGWKRQRVLYRVLYFYIKALLNTWDNGLKAFTEIFMPHLLMPGGGTVEQMLLPKLQKAIETEDMKDIKLLEKPETPKVKKDKVIEMEPT